MPAPPITRAIDAVIDDVTPRDRTLVARVNTNALDYFNSVIDPDGIRLDAYRKNPVVLWEHSRDPRRHSDPIARNLWIKPNSPSRATAIIAKKKFLDDDFSQQRYEWYRDDVLNTFSIRVIPIEWGPPTRAEIRERPELDNDRPNETRGQFSGPLIYRSSILAEYSGVSCPGNPECGVISVERAMSLLTLADSGKLWLPDDVRPAIEARARSVSIPRAITDSEGGLAGGGATVEPDDDGGPMRRSPVPWHEAEDTDEKRAMVESREDGHYAPCHRCMGGPHGSVDEALRHDCTADRPGEGAVDRTIKHEDGGWVVYSEEGKRLSKPYKTKAEADKRLGQIEYFKHERSADDPERGSVSKPPTVPAASADGVDDIERDDPSDIDPAKHYGHNSYKKNIKKRGDKWVVVDNAGKPMGEYDSAEEAEHRLKQMVWFKDHPDGERSADAPVDELAIAMERARNHGGPTLATTLALALIEIRDDRDRAVERARAERDLYEFGRV